MTWEIVVGLITIIGFLITIGKVISGNTKALTKLDCSINELQKALNKQEVDVNDLSNKVDSHEIRIVKLEEHNKEKINNG